MAELSHRGLAHPVDWTKDGRPTRWQISAEGHALLGRLMRENALEACMAGAGDWVQPPSRQIPGLPKDNE